MVKAIVLDDEQHCISRLESLLSAYDNIGLSGSFTSVEEGINAIAKLKPDLVFLDVELRNKTAFDLLAQLPEIDFEIIFTTAYAKYAVEAFKFSALDYLLKPVDEEALQKALNKAEAKFSKTDMLKKMEALFDNIKSINKSRKICVSMARSLEILETSDIIRCESSGNYTSLYMKNKQKLVVSKTLGEFDELLTGYNFFRIHYSHLINLAFLKSYNREGFVTLTDGSAIEVSTRRREVFLKKLHSL